MYWPYVSVCFTALMLLLTFAATFSNLLYKLQLRFYRRPSALRDISKSNISQLFLRLSTSSTRTA